VVHPIGGGSARELLSANVLIQTEVGKARQVAQVIRGIDGVQWDEDVAGPYDLIAPRAAILGRAYPRPRSQGRRARQVGS
jgi:hypothetical protein